MADDLNTGIDESIAEWLSRPLFKASPDCHRLPEILERQVGAVCDVVRDRLEADPKTTSAELEALAIAAGKAIAAGVAALSAGSATPPGG